MSIVTIKNKYQIVIPQSVRKQVGVVVGDFLEATVEKGKIVFQPKSLVDRGIAQSLKEFKQGHSFGPFATANEVIASLKGQLKKRALEKHKKVLK
ncbi:MAG: Transcriptional regulator, AbrB family [Parcubacteria group bacterium GW2011_GWF2_39_8b]|uniref:SpoVT-AbrB domain-containing protein n=2 Tax=Candidatus Zambryskiibacteriota TaxID=1817925 RepID=A0A1G2T926_9BACT|nr:MAG: Transcriptional regulator, AbrB family [Parcubacteria group bacterium GW2011_GWF2_39_8b]KKR46175.1 MAG: Transcriptional regulator, AbrB family [Parcubacteria group bacterium GW2011_GWA2_40_14]OHA93101.1 MAG: hypothetical protein A2W58_03440 [Candidatus Zambryskibacteria bacterium RIFCSPHIGHO2_02_38_10.5]OHA95679.1 MAG: hypothetical protein A3C63_00360 [Candidatus Zambryskibacteria bacterium RIFCSPHIGHO2_02_FULL_39_82]OHA98597.1 MAG: hypothetical protein A3E32_03605 [Candidatus Zambryski